MSAVGSLAYLNGKLDTALADAGDTTWTSAEKDDVLISAVASLWPRVSRPLDPDQYAVVLADNTVFYPLPQGILAVSSVSWIDTDGNTERGPLGSGAWLIEGDPIGGAGLLWVHPDIAVEGGTLRLHGYGRYDAYNNLIPVDYVALVLALARAECYRRLVGDRARFREWLSRQQTQNVSVNEAVQMVNEADNEAEKLRTRLKVWQRPVPARAG